MGKTRNGIWESKPLFGFYFREYAFSERYKLLHHFNIFQFRAKKSFCK